MLSCDVLDYLSKIGIIIVRVVVIRGHIEGATCNLVLLLLLDGNDHSRRNCVHAKSLITWSLESWAFLERTIVVNSTFSHRRQVSRVMLIRLLSYGRDVQIVIVPAKLDRMPTSSTSILQVQIDHTLP